MAARSLDPTFRTLLQVAVGAFGGPAALTVFNLATSTAERVAKARGDSLQVMTREEMLAAIREANAEELPDVGERPDREGE